MAAVAKDLFFRVHFNRLMDSGLYAEMDPRAWYALCALARYANKDGECRPSQQTLAKLMGVSVTTANDWIKRLTEFTWEGQPVVVKRRRGSTSNMYKIMPLSGVAIFNDKA